MLITGPDALLGCEMKVDSLGEAFKYFYPPLRGFELHGILALKLPTLEPIFLLVMAQAVEVFTLSFIHEVQIRNSVTVSTFLPLRQNCQERL